MKTLGISAPEPLLPSWERSISEPYGANMRDLIRSPIAERFFIKRSLNPMVVGFVYFVFAQSLVLTRLRAVLPMSASLKINRGGRV